jgi:hypothetical protein
VFQEHRNWKPWFSVVNGDLKRKPGSNYLYYIPQIFCTAKSHRSDMWWLIFFLSSNFRWFLLSAWLILKFVDCCQVLPIVWAFSVVLWRDSSEISIVNIDMEIEMGCKLSNTITEGEKPHIVQCQVFCILFTSISCSHVIKMFLGVWRKSYCKIIDFHGGQMFCFIRV